MQEIEKQQGPIIQDSKDLGRNVNFISSTMGINEF